MCIVFPKPAKKPKKRSTTHRNTGAAQPSHRGGIVFEADISKLPPSVFAKSDHNHNSVYCSGEVSCSLEEPQPAMAAYHGSYADSGKGGNTSYHRAREETKAFLFNEVDVHRQVYEDLNSTNLAADMRMKQEKEEREMRERELEEGNTKRDEELQRLRSLIKENDRNNKMKEAEAMAKAEWIREAAKRGRDQRVWEREAYMARYQIGNRMGYVGQGELPGPSVEKFASGTNTPFNAPTADIIESYDVANNNYFLTSAYAHSYRAPFAKRAIGMDSSSEALRLDDRVREMERKQKELKREWKSEREREKERRYDLLQMRVGMMMNDRSF